MKYLTESKCLISITLGVAIAACILIYKRCGMPRPAVSFSSLSWTQKLSKHISQRTTAPSSAENNISVKSRHPLPTCLRPILSVCHRLPLRRCPRFCIHCWQTSSIHRRRPEEGFLSLWKLWRENYQANLWHCSGPHPVRFSGWRGQIPSGFWT